MTITRKWINDLSYKIIGCAIEVHRELGPGLLESVYEECLVYELQNAGMDVQTQLFVPIVYKQRSLKSKLRLDLLVNQIIVVELKSVESLLPIHSAQLLSHLKLSGKPKGLLINFNCDNVSRQIVSLVTENFARLS